MGGNGSSMAPTFGTPREDRESGSNDRYRNASMIGEDAQPIARDESSLISWLV